jgi:anti-sigma factor RsiW
MTCRELAALVTERLEGRLPDRERARVEAHLAECDDCAVYTEQIEQVVTALGRLGADDAPIAPAVLDDLIEALRDRAVPG